MNAKESLAADRDAEQAWTEAEAGTDGIRTFSLYVRAIAAELRAARIYANYLEGREGARSSVKRLTAAAEPES